MAACRRRRTRGERTASLSQRISRRLRASLTPAWPAVLRRRRNEQRPARRLRLLRRLLVRFGQLHRPRLLLGGVDLEEAGAIKTARQAIAGAANRELLVARAHEGL